MLEVFVVAALNSAEQSVVVYLSVRFYARSKVGFTGRAVIFCPYHYYSGLSMFGVAFETIAVEIIARIAIKTTI